MSAAAQKRKRGRPPRRFPSLDGTELTLREMGISRKLASDCIAIASIPEDVFAEQMAARRAGKRKVTTSSLVRLACELGTTNRKAPMRDLSALDDARKALAKLSRGECIIIARELNNALEGVGS